MKKHIILLISFLFVSLIGFSSIELRPSGEEITIETTVDQLNADLIVFDLVLEGVIVSTLPNYTNQVEVVQSATMPVYIQAEALNNISKLQLKKGGVVDFYTCASTATLNHSNARQLNEAFDYSMNKLLKQSWHKS